MIFILVAPANGNIGHAMLQEKEIEQAKEPLAPACEIRNISEGDVSIVGLKVCLIFELILILILT